MRASLTRRTFSSLLLAAVATSCVEGKLASTINFELAKQASAQLDAALVAFANDHRFKIIGRWDPTSLYWPWWVLSSDDIDLRVAPLNDEPASADAPPSVGPIVYTARFYDRSTVGGSTRMTNVTSAFARLLGGIEGVRKLGNEQAP